MADRDRLARLMKNLQRRALVVQHTREFFQQHGFLEVDTPVRVPAVAPEAPIIPFDSEGWCLLTSPELHMKRLMAAGYQRIFQLAHCFRKGERGRWHNPEFTLLEWYRAGGDYLQVVKDTEELVVHIAQRLGSGPTISYQGQAIDLTPPWPRTRVREAFLKRAGWDPSTAGDLSRFDEDLVTKVIPGFPPGHPVILLDYPAPFASLARLKPCSSNVAERAEVFIAGLELANAYSELIDPVEQEKRFREEIALIEKEQGRLAPMPEHFLEALAHMPPSGGIALGIDRLVMLFCDAASIDEVVAFTSDTV